MGSIYDHLPRYGTRATIITQISEMDTVQLLSILLDDTDQSTFLQRFQRFCLTTLPPNPSLREDLISCIQHSSDNAVALRPSSWYDKESLLPSLPDIWQQTAKHALARPDTINIEIPNINWLSLFSLSPGSTLECELVDAYINLIRQEGTVISSTSLLDTAGGTSQNVMDQEIDLNQVRHRGQIFIPIYHSPRRHWSFVRLLSDPEDSRGVLIESYNSAYIEAVPLNFVLWCRQRFRDVPVRGLIAQSPHHSPGSTDCGLFMLLGIRLLSIGSHHLTQTEADVLMPSFRYRIIAELLAGNLDPSVDSHAAFLHKQQTVSLNSNYNRDLDMSLEGGLDDKGFEEGQTQPSSLSASLLLDKDSVFVTSCVESFADEESMLRILRIAVQSHRNSKPSLTNDDLGSFLLKVENDDHYQDTLMNRYYREQYSRMFYRSLKEVGASSSRTGNRARVHIQTKFHLQPGKKAWKSAQSQAARASIWTELVTFFHEYLEFPSTALCGAVESTAVMEGMNRNARDSFFRKLKCRVLDPEDKVLPNLNAASSIIHCLLSDTLPDYTLAIEREIDLKLMSFVAAVSLEEKLRLPSY